jgi:hypothetical protein
MYHHHWHIDYPMLFLILGLVLLAWAVTYSIATAPGTDLGGIWSGGQQAAMTSSSDMVQVAPNLVVPRDYFIQEKMYHAAPVAAQVELAPGFNVPLGYYIQEKMYHADAVVQ